MRSRKLPLGPLELRDWGLNRETLGSASHGAHKRTAIEGILATYPEMKFALIGDDSQGDLTAFAAIALDNPGRVRAIFIRKVGEAMSAEEIDASYLAQMAAYKMVLEAAWPNRRIRPALLYTDGPKLFELNETLLQSSRNRLAGGL